jgi:hypothetical protein
LYIRHSEPFDFGTAKVSGLILLPKKMNSIFSIMNRSCQ